MELPSVSSHFLFVSHIIVCCCWSWLLYLNVSESCLILSKRVLFLSKTFQKNLYVTIPTTKLFGKPQCGTYRRGQSQGSRSHEGTLGFFGTGVWLGVIGPRLTGGRCSDWTRPFWRPVDLLFCLNRWPGIGVLNTSMLYLFILHLESLGIMYGYQIVLCIFV